MSSPAPIAARVEQFFIDAADQFPADVLAVFAEEHTLQAGRSAADPPDIGASMPDGQLLDAHGRATTLTAARAGRAAVVVFYQGAWCPFCNIALRTYQQTLAAELDARGVALIAISPQKPDEAARVQDKNELTFTVLSDPGNQIAGALGILTSIGSNARATMAQLGVDVPASNADGTWSIPMPTVAILDATGAIRLLDVHPDYTTRTEPDVILKHVSDLTG